MGQLDGPVSIAHKMKSSHWQGSSHLNTCLWLEECVPLGRKLRFLTSWPSHDMPGGSLQRDHFLRERMMKTEAVCFSITLSLKGHAITLPYSSCHTDHPWHNMAGDHTRILAEVELLGSWVTSLIISDTCSPRNSAAADPEHFL